jgi:hypothetical protein
MVSTRLERAECVKLFTWYISELPELALNCGVVEVPECEGAATHFCELEIRIVTEPDFGAVGLFEDYPDLADAQAKRGRLPVHVQTGLQ